MKGNHVANVFCKVFQINIYTYLFCFVEMGSYSVVQACLEPWSSSCLSPLSAGISVMVLLTQLYIRKGLLWFVV